MPNSWASSNVGASIIVSASSWNISFGETFKLRPVLGGLHQPTEDRIGIDLEHPRCATNAQAFGQTRDNAHDELDGSALAMKDRTMGLIKIALARDTL